MIDRDARNIMLEAIEKFMRGEITDSEFNMTVAGPALIEGTDDDTVTLLDSMFLEYVESPEDKTFPSNRKMWEFFNRARLLMASGAEAEIVVTRKRKWLKWQGVALVAILIFYPAFGYVISQGIETRQGTILASALALLCGLVTFWLSKQRTNEEQPDEPCTKYEETWPFSSHEEMIELRQCTPDFEEWKYPFAEDLPLQKQRSLMSSPIIWLAMPIIAYFYCLLSPFILLGQLKPSVDIEMRLVWKTDARFRGIDA